MTIKRVISTNLVFNWYEWSENLYNNPLCNSHNYYQIQILFFVVNSFTTKVLGVSDFYFLKKNIVRVLSGKSVRML